MFVSVLSCGTNDGAVTFELSVGTLQPMPEAVFNRIAGALRSIVELAADDIKGEQGQAPTPEQVDLLLSVLRRPREDKPS